MARRRERADQVLALDLAAAHFAQEVGLLRQAALANRARLRRAQTGDRLGALRRAQVARVSSPRDDVHSRLRLSGRGAWPFPPSRSWRPIWIQETWSSRKSTIRKTHRYVRSDTTRLRLRRCTRNYSRGSCDASTAALAASGEMASNKKRLTSILSNFVTQ